MYDRAQVPLDRRRACDRPRTWVQDIDGRVEQGQAVDPVRQDWQRSPLAATTVFVRQGLAIVDTFTMVTLTRTKTATKGRGMQHERRRRTSVLRRPY
jgi:hypothetical protein